MNCQYCNSPIPSGVNQCPGCGAPVQQPQQQVPQGQMQPYPQIQVPQGQTQQLYPQVQIPQGQQQYVQPLYIPPRQGSDMPVVNLGNVGAPAIFLPRKSRAVYIVLAIFFGYLGLHNFYAGREGYGLAQLFISILLGWVGGLGLIISWVWAFIECFVINKDGSGIPFK